MSRGLVRNDHPRTAHEAADHAPTNLREGVWTYINQRGQAGATDEEIQDAMRMNPSTQRPRRRELVQAQRVYDSGRRRETRSGRKAIVWCAHITVEAWNAAYGARF